MKYTLYYICINSVKRVHSGINDTHIKAYHRYIFKFNNIVNIYFEGIENHLKKITHIKVYIPLLSFTLSLLAFLRHFLLPDEF